MLDLCPCVLFLIKEVLNYIYLRNARTGCEFPLEKLMVGVTVKVLEWELVLELGME